MRPPDTSVCTVLPSAAHPHQRQGLNLTPLSSSILGGYQGSSVLNTTSRAGASGCACGVVWVRQAGCVCCPLASSFELQPLPHLPLLPPTPLDTTTLTGIAALGVGVLIQLWVAAVNYAKVSPEGYSPAADVKVWFTRVGSRVSDGSSRECACRCKLQLAVRQERQDCSGACPSLKLAPACITHSPA